MHFLAGAIDLKLDYMEAIKAKKLLPIAELNNGFIRPKYPQQVLVSYYQASIICDYIDEKFGFPAIKKMLLLYKAGKGHAGCIQGSSGDSSRPVRHGVLCLGR